MKETHFPQLSKALVMGSNETRSFLHSFLNVFFNSTTSLFSDITLIHLKTAFTYQIYQAIIIINNKFFKKILNRNTMK